MLNCLMASNKPTEALTERFKLRTLGSAISIRTSLSQVSLTSGGNPAVSLPNNNQSSD